MARSKLTLQDVARRAADLNGGKGGRGLQRLANAKGLTLSYATVDRILQGKYESTPQRQTIEALAVLAELPIEKVYAAAGLPLPMAPLAEQLPNGSDNLTTHQRRVVLDVIRGFIRDNDRMADLEQERDARVPARTALLELVEEHDDASLEAMDLEDLYDLALLLSRAVPAMDEVDALVRLATRAEQIIEQREANGAERPVADLPQPDGVNPDPELSAAARERRGRWVRVRDSAHGLGSAGAGGEDLDGPATRADWARAADDSGPSLLEADDARARARGEESQDPGSDEPA